MLKKTLLLTVGALLAAGSFAATLSPEQALSRAQSASGAKKIVSAVATPKLAYTAVDAQGEPAVYVFNSTSGEGTFLLSADDVAVPMLGYTDAGSFDPTNIPPDMKYWMDSYAEAISYAKKHGMKADPKATYPTSWGYVEPLLKTSWDQGNPYNQMTPTSGNSHMPTGCVATAMAQIMKYWNYPEVGQGSISYASYSTRLSMTFNQPFDWNNMLDRYTGDYSQTQADAVAYLMKSCGYASKMQYAVGGSGTQTQLAGLALVDNFKYDGNISWAERYQYTTMEWAEIIYNQMKGGMPILFSANSPDGGHAFVFDGYDGNGYFHVNWGWGGVCNGFYLVDALNPSQQGTGGFYGGYNLDQSILYNIQKPTGNPVQPRKPFMAMKGSVNVRNNSNALTFSLVDWNDPGYFNDSMQDINVVFGIEITKDDGSGAPSYVNCTSPTNLSAISPGAYYPTDKVKPVARFNTGLPDGRYMVRLVWKNGSNGAWQHFEIQEGFFDYVYVIKSGVSYTVQNMKTLEFTMTGAKLLTPLYYMQPCQVECTLTNPNNTELTQLVVPTLMTDGVLAYEGDSQLVSLAPGETRTVQLNTTFRRIGNAQVPSTAKSVDFTLGAIDIQTGQKYGSFGTVTMKRSSTNLKLSVDNFAITNAAEKETVNGIDNVYGIDNFSNIGLTITIAVGGSNAFLASPITATVYEVNPQTGTLLAEVYEKEFENMVYIGTGETATVTTTLNYNNFDISKMYGIRATYLNGTTATRLADLYFAASSGVDDVIGDDNALNLGYAAGQIDAASAAGIASIEVFEISGAAVMSVPAAGAEKISCNLEMLAKGIYLVRATDRKGSVKTIKIRR